MNIISNNLILDNVLPMNATQVKHFGYVGAEKTVELNTNQFAQQLNDALEKVNASQNSAQALSRQAIVAPETINAHDLSIGLATANLSLNITKNVVDRVIQAYRDISTLR